MTDFNRSTPMTTLLFIFILTYVVGVECYPRKRATGGVPHLLHDLFIEGQRTQTLESQLLANVSSTSGIASLLEMQSQQLQKMVASLTTLTKGLHLTAGDCSDVAAQGPYANGIFVVTPWDDLGYNGAFKVYCDMETDNGGWTVFQRRFNGSVDFYRDWEDYKQGFGDLNGEFWLGLTKLNRLTSTGLSWQLRVELEDFDGNTGYAQYDDFRIGDEASGFQLTIGTYSGTAGDSLTYHANMPFTTKDKDNDKSSSNCAVSKKGGWWYKGCHHSNLNGLYLESPQVTTAGMTWYHFTDNSYKTLKTSEMKIRPVY